VGVALLESLSPQEQEILSAMTGRPASSDFAPWTSRHLLAHTPFLRYLATAALPEEQKQRIQRMSECAATSILSDFCMPVHGDRFHLSKLRDQVASVIWVRDLGHDNREFDALSEDDALLLRGYLGIQRGWSSLVRQQVIAGLLRAWRSTPAFLPFALSDTGAPLVREKRHRTEPASADGSLRARGLTPVRSAGPEVRDYRLLVYTEPAWHLSTQAAMASALAQTALRSATQSRRQAQEAERTCALVASHAARVSILANNAILDHVCGPPPSQRLVPSGRALAAVDPEAGGGAAQDRGSLLPIGETYYIQPRPPSPPSFTIQRPHRALRCAFGSHIPCSSAVVGTALGLSVMTDLPCGFCAGPSHLPGECPTAWGAAGRPLPGFDIDGDKDDSMWIDQNPTFECYRLWTAFLADRHNFPNGASPADFEHAPTLESFRGMAGVSHSPRG